jgi:hypothetical protein
MTKGSADVRTRRRDAVGDHPRALPRYKAGVRIVPKHGALKHLNDHLAHLCLGLIVLAESDGHGWQAGRLEGEPFNARIAAGVERADKYCRTVAAPLEVDASVETHVLGIDARRHAHRPTRCQKNIARYHQRLALGDAR